MTGNISFLMRIHLELTLLRENKSFKNNFKVEFFQLLGYSGKNAFALKNAKNKATMKITFFSHVMTKGAKISDDETNF